jgi:hypothetical protein
LLRFTALLHLLTRLLFLAAIIGVPVSLFHFDDPRLVAVIPALLLPTGTAWLICASKVGCRVCGMRMFFNKKCAKSRKAPDWPLLGPHNTLAIRSLVCRQVRCPYCGTPNELTGRRDGGPDY